MSRSALEVWGLAVILGSTGSAQVTQRVSVDSAGAQGNGDSDFHSISADGRYVAFGSFADNLVTGDTNVAGDVFVRDRQSGTTERVSVDSGGAQGNSYSDDPSISADGRYVAFASHAWLSDIFVRDRQSGTTELVSVATGGAQANGDSGWYGLSISADGRYVAFTSVASNLVPGDTNGAWDVFVRDRLSGTTERVSIDSGGAQGNDYSWNTSISADGRYVAFGSIATNLVPGDTNGNFDVFVRDRQSGTTERVSIATNGTQGNNVSFAPSISANGRYVAFASDASNLVPGDTNGWAEVFLRDRQNGTIERVSIDSGGAQGNYPSFGPSISVDGRYVAFYSYTTNLVPGDTNGHDDVFVRDRLGGPVFTSLCDPGVSGVIACPCTNPPSGPGRGCDNSSATGGAILSASGGTFLSSDSLVFTTSGERSTAFSLVLQGNALVSNGLVYGQSVWCVGGSFKRLYRKAAANGSITAPDFGAGDPTVSARSAAKGDPIQAGQSRWYLVYYRDPTVLGGCPASSTFNATQSGQVTWSP